MPAQLSNGGTRFLCLSAPPKPFWLEDQCVCVCVSSSESESERRRASAHPWSLWVPQAEGEAAPYPGTAGSGTQRSSWWTCRLGLWGRSAQQQGSGLAGERRRCRPALRTAAGISWYFRPWKWRCCSAQLATKPLWGSTQHSVTRVSSVSASTASTSVSLSSSVEKLRARQKGTEPQREPSGGSEVGRSGAASASSPVLHGGRLRRKQDVLKDAGVTLSVCLQARHALKAQAGAAMKTETSGVRRSQRELERCPSIYPHGQLRHHVHDSLSTRCKVEAF